MEYKSAIARKMVFTAAIATESIQTPTRIGAGIATKGDSSTAIPVTLSLLTAGLKK